MSLLERILESGKHGVPCNECIHLIFPKKDLPFCKVKDRILLTNFPPTKCELRKGETMIRNGYAEITKIENGFLVEHDVGCVSSHISTYFKNMDEVILFLKQKVFMTVEE